MFVLYSLIVLPTSLEFPYPRVTQTYEKLFHKRCSILFQQLDLRKYSSRHLREVRSHCRARRACNFFLITCLPLFASSSSSSTMTSSSLKDGRFSTVFVFPSLLSFCFCLCFCRCFCICLSMSRYYSSTLSSSSSLWSLPPVGSSFVGILHLYDNMQTNRFVFIIVKERQSFPRRHNLLSFSS